MRIRLLCVAVTVWCVLLGAAQNPPQAKPNYPAPTPGDFTVKGFRFKTGEQMDVRMHYYTLGTPAKDASGRTTNAVIILHGTGGSGRQFFGQNFAGMLFGPGQLLDVSKYFIVMPDNVGHGQSSKPSDGMRMRFPHYDYDDMVALQHELLTQGLGISHLRLVTGTSMGCMHSWVWAENYPDFMDAAMPLACLPTQIAGRNRMWRKMLMDGIRSDPGWKDGNYTEQPQMGLRLAQDLLMLVGTTPLVAQRQAATRDDADRAVEQRVNAALRTLDANDVLYQFDSSRNYNPEPKLESIRAPVMAVNTADDFINPPELGILERDIRRVRQGRAVVLPTSEQTRGHGSHTLPVLWGQYLADLLKESGGLAPGTSWSRPEQRVESVPIAIGAPSGPGGAEIAELSAKYGLPVYRVGRDVKPPKARYSPNPSYTESARRAKNSGTVVLSAVVGPEGAVREVSLQRSTGDASLDRSAVETARRWQFEPATKDGRPVAVELKIEMSFRVQ